MQAPKLCGPRGGNDAAALVAQSVASGPGVCTSNLDSTRMRIVKRGSVVSYHGLRARVQRVRLGFFWASTLDISGRAINRADFHGRCRHVQVIA